MKIRPQDKKLRQGMALKIWGISFLCLQGLYALEIAPNLPSQGVISPDVDSFYDKTLDYSQMAGRVSDKDWTNHILKIQTETQNVKFFRAGDPITFKVHLHEGPYPCEGYVQDHEHQYLVVYVKNLEECWKDKGYFRRGTQLQILSPKLAQRVVEASQYRKVLIQSRQDFLVQLNTINHYLWTFQQEKIQVAAEFDKRILAIKNERQLALDELLSKKEEKVILQKELVKKLDIIDEALNFYRVERQENLFDRWNMDHDLGHPVGKRPPEPKQVENNSLGNWFKE